MKKAIAFVAWLVVCSIAAFYITTEVGMVFFKREVPSSIIDSAQGKASSLVIIRPLFTEVVVEGTGANTGTLSVQASGDASLQIEGSTYPLSVDSIVNVPLRWGTWSAKGKAGLVKFRFRHEEPIRVYKQLKVDWQIGVFWLLAMFWFFLYLKGCAFIFEKK